jgi:hypothetical protein
LIYRTNLAYLLTPPPTIGSEELPSDEEEMDMEEEPSVELQPLDAELDVHTVDGQSKLTLWLRGFFLR